MTGDIEELRMLAASEPIAKFLHMELLHLSPGHSRIALTVSPDHLNFNGVGFGGIIMSLADQAFAYATNSVVRPSFASQFNIHYLAPVKAGQRLTADGRVFKTGKRVNICEMLVTNEEGKLIAKATGTTITAK